MLVWAFGFFFGWWGTFLACSIISYFDIFSETNDQTDMTGIAESNII